VVDVSSGFEDVLADAEGSCFGLSFDAGVERELDDVLLEGKGRVGPSLR
jgi:hypothetical protein